MMDSENTNNGMALAAKLACMSKEGVQYWTGPEKTRYVHYCKTRGFTTKSIYGYTAHMRDEFAGHEHWVYKCHLGGTHEK